MEKIIFLDKADDAEIPVNASDAEVVDAAVRWINRKVESTVHFGLIQIGFYLLNNFFNGDIEQALSRNPHKQHSFRKLCRRSDLAISSTHLVNSVKLVVQERSLARDGAFQKLPVSHKIALLPIKDIHQKKMMARLANDERLSVRALTREVRSRVGTRRPIDATDWSRRIRLSLSQLRDLTDVAHLHGLSPREASALDQAIVDTRKQLQATLADLRGIHSLPSPEVIEIASVTPIKREVG